MNSVTLQDISEELQRGLRARAEANHRSVEEEARVCLEYALEADVALEAMSARRWQEIEPLLGEALRASSTPLTEADRNRYRELARGYRTSQQNVQG